MRDMNVDWSLTTAFGTISRVNFLGLFDDEVTRKLNCSYPIETNVAAIVAAVLL